MITAGTGRCAFLRRISGYNTQTETFAGGPVSPAAAPVYFEPEASA